MSDPDYINITNIEQIPRRKLTQEEAQKEQFSISPQIVGNMAITGKTSRKWLLEYAGEDAYNILCREYDK